MLESYVGGPIKLQKYDTSWPPYDKNNNVLVGKQIEEASECLFAFIYLKNSDQEKYGAILSNLVTQKSLGNDRYPKTIVESNNVLSDPTFDNTKSKCNSDCPPRQNNKNIEQNKKDDESPIIFCPTWRKMFLLW